MPSAEELRAAGDAFSRLADPDPFGLHKIMDDAFASVDDVLADVTALREAVERGDEAEAARIRAKIDARDSGEEDEEEDEDEFDDTN